ncbi:MAG: DUF1206 domain-containing protein [Silicimonas sp.]|nr:DUF1206 domain-containing protein [Silicimonas sp.]
MRAGYGARALVYLVLGGLTLAAAWTGGQTEGTQGALASLKSAPFGVLLLWIIALGLLCYAVWRLIAAWYDLERRGDDDEGLAKRAGLAVTGIIHAGLGVAVALLAMGERSGGSGGAQNWTAKLMSLPFGKWLVAAVALGIIGAAIHYVLKGWQRKYERHIRVTSTTRKLDPALRFGFVAYGVVLGIVGAFLLVAALQADPSDAKGIGAALDYVRGQPFGRWMLGVLGLGLLAFALENAVEAVYRVVPRLQGPDVDTLKDYVESKA